MNRTHDVYHEGPDLQSGATQPTVDLSPLYNRCPSLSPIKFLNAEGETRTHTVRFLKPASPTNWTTPA